MFIGLTQTNGDRFYVNSDHIIRVTSHGGPATIKTTDSELTLVNETIDEVLGLLEGPPQENRRIASN